MVRLISNNNTASPAVSVTANPDPGVTVYAVEEDLPTGLSPANIDQSGQWDMVNGKVKWGPFFDNTARTFNYAVSASPGTYPVSGVGSFDGASVATTGDAVVTIPSPTGPSTVVRSITSGTSVSVVATPAPTVSAYAVEEDLPSGLTPANISQSGQWDATNLKVKWGPFFDTTARTLSYTVTGSPGNYTLSGVGSFDGAGVTTTGDSQVTIAQPTAVSAVTRTITSGTNVSVAAAPAPTVSAYAVEEDLPPGLTPANISQSGQWDAANLKVKWGPFFDTTARTLTYTVTGSPGTYTLSGVGSFDGAGVTTTGDSQVTIAQPTGVSAATRTITSGTNVSVAATPAPTVSAYAVEEDLPPGLTPANLSQSGQWDAANLKVKWGPFFDATARTLSYTVSGSPGTYTLSGVGSFDGASVAATGDSVITIPQPAGCRLKGVNAANGSFSVLVTGPIGASYVIEVSSDLAIWQPFATNTIPASGSFNIADAIIRNQQPRFYRARAVQP